MSSTKNVPPRDEPEVTQEEDVSVDRKDDEGERLIQKVHNDKLEKKTPATDGSLPD